MILGHRNRLDRTILKSMGTKNKQRKCHVVAALEIM